MLFFNRLTAVVLAAALMAPAVLLEARTKKGDQYLAAGRKSEDRKEWDAALESYEKALSEDPSDMVYQMAAEKARFQASQAHVDKGLKIRNQGLLGEALLEFQKAYALNPGSAVAVQELRRTEEMIQRERKRVEETGKEAPAQERAMTPTDEVKKEIKDKIDRMLPVPELKPLNPEPINLKMNSQPVKVLFETVAKLAGINVVWDPEYAPPAPEKNKLSVELDNSTIDQALDTLAVLTKSYWKALSPNTIFITNDTVNKRHDYEEQVARIFYLSNVTANTDLQEIMNAARAVSDCQRMFPYTAQNAIIAKCEADRMDFVEKIINDLDKPRAEVVVDVLVLEAGSTFSRQITAAIASTGINSPISFTPRSSIQVPISSTSSTSTATTSTATATVTPTTTSSTSTTGSSIPLSNLGHLASADFSTTLPGALLQAAMSDARAKVLQAPQVRSVDGVKATLNIGDRVPTASGSFQPGIGGVGINPLVNTQFQYIDTGVNVEITPRVHDNGDVSIHVDLNINSVSSYVNLGGINQPVISQKKISHDIRMREGEVGLLGGLINVQEDKTVTGIPGLSSIPLLKRLFTGESTDHSRNELMIVLIPHVIRRPEITPENLRTIAVGNFTSVKVNYAPKPADVVVAGPGAEGVVAPSGPGGTTAPPATAPPATAPPATAPPATAPPATAPPATAPPATAPLATALPGPGVTPALIQGALAPRGPGGAPAPPGPGGTPAPAGNMRVYFEPSQATASPSGPITVSLLVEGGDDVASAPIEIQFDPKFLRLNNVSLGDFLSKDGQQPVFTKNILNDTGVAVIQLNRPPGSRGVGGSGTLVTLDFQAVARGATVVTVPHLAVRNAQGAIVSTSTPQLTVTVK